MIYLRLFWEFFKTGLFAVGGGLATLPFIYDMSDRTGWFSYQQIADMIAVSESTPGPIGVNTATYVGYITGGHAFYGLRPASAGLIAAAGFSVVMLALVREDAFKASGNILDLFSWKGLALAAVIWVLTNLVKKTKDLHPIFYIAASAVVGILAF